MKSILCVCLLAVAVAAPLGVGQERGQEPSAEEQERRIVHALSRLSFGPRPGDVARIRKIGLEAWIERQLQPDQIDESELETRLQERWPTFGLTPPEWEPPEEEAEDARAKRRQIRMMGRSAARELRAMIVQRTLESEKQLFEVMSDFWRNHLNVDVNKGTVTDTATSYEVRVLRQHCFGRFEEMLMASAKHPAMLVYLDNYLSRRPPSKSELRQIERRVRRQTGSREQAKQQAEAALQRGLNENYARELMELHTLGVDRGYTQDDVIEVALAFTGWSVAGGGREGFQYREELHAPGRKTVLKKTLPGGRRKSGIVEGEAVVKMLASHRYTSEYLAWKLCKRLVADEPPQEIIDAAAKAYRKTRGDLRETVRAIVTHPEFWNEAHYQTKFKTPFEYVISAVRATGAQVEDPAPLIASIKEMGMPLYECEDPTGYRDTTEAWRDPGVMALRWQFAMDLVFDRIRGVRIPTAFYYDLPEDLLALSEALTRRLCPAGLGPDTKRVLERVLFREVQKAGSLEKVDHRKMARTLTAILIGGPEFQQQ